MDSMQEIKKIATQGLDLQDEESRNGVGPPPIGHTNRALGSYAVPFCSLGSYNSYHRGDI